jgi:hypothetical protein
VSLCLVLHRPAGRSEQEAATALAAAVWEVAEAHWTVAPLALLLASDLSPDYLHRHFRAALGEGLLLVTAVGPRACWSGLPADADRFLRETLA